MSTKNKRRRQLTPRRKTSDSRASESVKNRVVAAGDAADCKVAASGAAKQELVESDSSKPLLAVEKVVAIVLLTPTFVWAFWPTVQELVWSWSREPDYSHGFLVAPLAGVMLWIRRGAFPGVSPGLAWPGLVLVALSAVVRILGAAYFVSSLDAWAMVLWIGGAVWFLGGTRLFLWASPAIAFLVFAIPLPFKVEHMLSWQLQRVATTVSAWVLQFLGQPALGEGNTILLGDHHLEVERACSGLRIFVGIASLAFFYLLSCRGLGGRDWF